MKKITYVTGNWAKLASAKQALEPLGYEVDNIKLETPELQSNDVKEVAEYSHVYTCGPEPMLKAVYNATTTGGHYSFEERMGCGFGACMGCSCKTKYGNKRICKDGPVLDKEEIIW